MSRPSEVMAAPAAWPSASAPTALTIRGSWPSRLRWTAKFSAAPPSRVASANMSHRTSPTTSARAPAAGVIPSCKDRFSKGCRPLVRGRHGSSTAVRCQHGRAAGVAHHQAEVQQDVPRGQFRAAQPLEHGADRDRAHVRAGLVDGCQRHRQQAGVLYVVNADHPDVARDRDREHVSVLRSCAAVKSLAQTIPSGRNFERMRFTSARSSGSMRQTCGASPRPSGLPGTPQYARRRSAQIRDVPRTSRDGKTHPANAK